MSVNTVLLLAAHQMRQLQPTQKENNSRPMQLCSGASKYSQPIQDARS